MTDIIIVLVIAAIVALAGRYVYKAKKSGAKCIGCHVEGGCSAKANACSCGCGGTVDAAPVEEGAPCCCCGKDTE